ncbi:DUF3923 family protein [Marinococcus halophilus]
MSLHWIGNSFYYCCGTKSHVEGDTIKWSWIGWSIVNVFWLLLFIPSSVFVWTREVDGAGAVQTPEI